MICDKTSAEPQQDGISSGHRIVLIVDDDREQAEALAYGLSQQGFDPMVTTTVTSGMMAAELHHPLLILLDIKLPDGNGLELCEQISDSPSTCDIPIIVITGTEGKDLVKRSRNAGCTYFVRKPYDPNALLTLIDDSIRKQRAWDE